MNVSVLGGGAWGTALASMLAHHRADEEIILWARDADTVAQINNRHRNGRYLGDITLPGNLRATTALDAAGESDIVLAVIPTQSLSGTLPDIQTALRGDATLVLCAKGIDRVSGDFPREIAGRYLERERVAALSGPSFARDVARGLPTAVSLAADGLARARKLAETLSSPRFRIYASDDLAGVEAGGALKNVLALAVGVARGLELGASAEAALIARGFAEMTRLAIALGGRMETLSGLSGLGDLVLTCSSPQSRNFAYGMALARGDDLASMKLAEGVHTASMSLERAQSHDIDVPIIAAVCAVLAGEQSPLEAVTALLTRPLKSESAGA